MPQTTRAQLAGYAVLALLVLVIGGRWLASHGARAQAGAFPRDAVRSRPLEVKPAPRKAVVHVVGAVRHPGVYTLSAGKRVADAIRCAGGPTRRGDVNAINLAAPVQDGVQVIVPLKGAAVAAPAGSAAGTAAAPGAPGAPVDINTADEAQLETLDGVGPATAAKILDYRRQHGGFRTVDDLMQVPGIGPKKLAALKGKVHT